MIVICKNRLSAKGLPTGRPWAICEKRWHEIGWKSWNKSYPKQQAELIGVDRIRHSACSGTALHGSRGRFSRPGHIDQDQCSPARSHQRSRGWVHTPQPETIMLSFTAATSIWTQVRVSELSLMQLKLVLFPATAAVLIGLSVMTYWSTASIKTTTVSCVNVQVDSLELSSQKRSPRLMKATYDIAQ